MLLLITHKGCLLPSSWFNQKCYSTVSGSESMSAVFWWYRWVSVTVLTLSHLLLQRWCGKDVVHSLYHDLTPCSFPSCNSLQILTVCSTHRSCYMSTSFLYSQEIPTTSLPTLSSINNDPIIYLKICFLPKTLGRKTAINFYRENNLYFLLYDQKKSSLLVRL